MQITTEKPRTLADEAEILKRCIRNLMHAYTKTNNTNRVEDLQKILGIVENSP